MAASSSSSLAHLTFSCSPSSPPPPPPPLLLFEMHIANALFEDIFREFLFNKALFRFATTCRRANEMIKKLPYVKEFLEPLRLYNKRANFDMRNLASNMRKLEKCQRYPFVAPGGGIMFESIDVYGRYPKFSLFDQTFKPRWITFNCDNGFPALFSEVQRQLQQQTTIPQKEEAKEEEEEEEEEEEKAKNDTTGDGANNENTNEKAIEPPPLSSPSSPLVFPPHQHQQKEDDDHHHKQQQEWLFGNTEKLTRLVFCDMYSWNAILPILSHQHDKFPALTDLSFIQNDSAGEEEEEDEEEEEAKEDNNGKEREEEKEMMMTLPSTITFLQLKGSIKVAHTLFLQTYKTNQFQHLDFEDLEAQEKGGSSSSSSSSASSQNEECMSSIAHMLFDNMASSLHTLHLWKDVTPTQIRILPKTISFLTLKYETISFLTLKYEDKNHAENNIVCAISNHFGCGLQHFSFTDFRSSTPVDFDDLVKLTHLETLELTFVNVKNMAQNIPKFTHLTKFVLDLGSLDFNFPWGQPDPYPYELLTLESTSLTDLKFCVSSFTILILTNMPNLKHLCFPASRACRIETEALGLLAPLETFEIQIKDPTMILSHVPCATGASLIANDMSQLPYLPKANIQTLTINRMECFGHKREEEMRMRVSKGEEEEEEELKEDKRRWGEEHEKEESLLFLFPQLKTLNLYMGERCGGGDFRKRWELGREEEKEEEEKSTDRKRMYALLTLTKQNFPVLSTLRVDISKATFIWLQEYLVLGGGQKNPLLPELKFLYIYVSGDVVDNHEDVQQQKLKTMCFESLRDMFLSNQTLKEIQLSERDFCSLFDSKTTPPAPTTAGVVELLDYWESPVFMTVTARKITYQRI